MKKNKKRLSQNNKKFITAARAAGWGVYFLNKPKKELKGKIGSLLEQGFEGLREWIFVEDGKKGWESLNLLQAGDYLIIYNKNNSIAFEGKIQPDSKTGRKRVHGTNDRYIPALNIAVRWVQKGWKPDDWAKMFSDKSDLRAVLRKK